MSVIPVVVEGWRVTDRWWTDSPVNSEWVEVDWGGRKVVMHKRTDETVWRIWKRQPST